MVAYRSVAFAIGALVAAHGEVALGQINKCQTRDGRTVYQEQPCAVEDKSSSIKKSGGGTSMPAASKSSGGAGTRKPEEDKALGNLVVMVSVERDCKQILGRYASMNEMLKSCVGPTASMGLHKDNDPANDPNYDYRLSASTDGFELSIAPRRPGLTGYFTDGKFLYENASGAATSQSKNLGALPF